MDKHLCGRILPGIDAIRHGWDVLDAINKAAHRIVSKQRQREIGLAVGEQIPSARGEGEMSRAPAQVGLAPWRIVGEQFPRPGILAIDHHAVGSGIARKDEGSARVGSDKVGVRGSVIDGLIDVDIDNVRQSSVRHEGKNSHAPGLMVGDLEKASAV